MSLYNEVRKDFTIAQSIFINNKHSRLINKNEYCNSIFTRERLSDQAWRSEIIIGKNNQLIPEEFTGFSINNENLNDLKWVCDSTTKRKIEYAIGINQQKLVRKYSNSEGVQFVSNTLWNLIKIHFFYKGEMYALSDGCYDDDNIEKILEKGCIEANQYLMNYSHNKFIEVLEKKVNLILPNTPSSIVFHELIGHHLEEGAQKGVRIGPETLFVKANSKFDFDDEGFPSFKKNLVENGYISNELYEREKEYKRSSVAGLYKAGPHGGKGTIRCTELYIENGLDNPKEFMNLCDQPIHCVNLSGGEYNNGFGIFKVKDAFLKKGNVKFKVKPFTFYININEFKNHLVGIGNDTTLAHSAMCTKDFVSIPTINYAPSILLVDVPILGG